MSQHLHAAKGRLAGTQPGTSNGKKVFSWEFYCAGQDVITVNVLLRKSASGGITFDAEWDTKYGPATRAEAPADSGVKFSAQTMRRRVAILTDSDIERLRRRTEALLNEQVLLRLGVHWEPWLEITIGGEDDKTCFRSGKPTLSAGLEVSIVQIERGVSPAGRVLIRRPDGEVRDFPPSVPYLAPDRSSIRLHDDEGVGISYIPDTPEHRATLEDLIARLRSLRQMIGAAASEEVIAVTGVVGLLPLLPESPADGCETPKPARNEGDE